MKNRNKPTMGLTNLLFWKRNFHNKYYVRFAMKKHCLLLKDSATHKSTSINTEYPYNHDRSD
jgi:hypothetical protein